MRPADAATAAARILEAEVAGRSIAVVLVTAAPDASRVGGRVLVTDAGVEGTLGDTALDREAKRLGREALVGTADGAHEVPLPDGPVTLYVESHHPSPELVIVGAGHIARPLCHLGALLGFRVTVLDDRPELATRERFPDAARIVRANFDDPFADVPIRASTRIILVTRGHRYDFECLRRILASDPLPAYMGMIGSRRRVRAAVTQLVREGIPLERLRRVRAPIGLDIRAETPAEIAVAVAGEIILAERGGSGRPLRDVERVVERFLEDDAQKRG